MPTELNPNSWAHCTRLSLTCTYLSSQLPLPSFLGCFQHTQPQPLGPSTDSCFLWHAFFWQPEQFLLHEAILTIPAGAYPSSPLIYAYYACPFCNRLHLTHHPLPDVCMVNKGLFLGWEQWEVFQLQEARLHGKTPDHWGYALWRGPWSPKLPLPQLSFAYNHKMSSSAQLILLHRPKTTRLKFPGL